MSYENTGCTPGLLIKKTCGVNCVWTAAACGNHCTGTARTTPPEAEEVCVPAGDFIRGDADFVDSSPVKNVYLSEYYIDRFPVTNKRYRACETAGVCGAPSEDIGYTSTLRDDYPVQSVSKANAIAFCQWDGGRKLASEAQWEKAARGPAPNWTKYIWGDQPDCATSPGPCPTPVAMSAYPVPFKYNELPAMRGFYGAEYLGHSTRELVLDGYYSGFYNDPQSLSDPVYNPNSPTFVTRGYYAHATPHPIGRREQVSLQILAGIHAVFRCTLAP